MNSPLDDFSKWLVTIENWQEFKDMEMRMMRLAFKGGRELQIEKDAKICKDEFLISGHAPIGLYVEKVINRIRNQEVE